MKKILLISLFFVTTITKGQITLENFYNNASLFSFVRLSLTDNKWAVIDANTITLYNENHSFYKTIPIVGAPVNPYDVLYISKDLFDTDSTTTEYMVDPGSLGTQIYREDGTLLFSEPGFSATYGIVQMSNPIRPAWKPIVMTSNGTKMILCGIDSMYNPNGFKVYSLPGIYLPTFVSTFDQTENGMQLSNPFPNPSGNSTKISYSIPDGETSVDIVLYRLNGTEAKRFQVDNTFNTLELNNSDLPSGTYFYQLVSKNQQSGSKKMIVIK